MVAFGFALQSHNPFLGYSGDFDEAASSCFKTAFVFGGLAGLSAGVFVLNAVKSKMGPPTSTRGDYQAV